MPSAPSASVPAGPACPIRTAMSVSTQEAAGLEVPEIRAYKLGKKRWSYNQVELVVCEEGTDRQLTVKQAVHTGTATAPLDNCGVTFQLQLANDEKLNLEAYLVYDGAALTPENEHEWTLVDRCACARGCQGPVIRAIQRFGKLGKRSWAGSPSPDVTDRTNHNMKDMRYMYLSFDEAGTHVSCKAFRLAAAVYDDATGARLGTAVTPPVRVLANNDVPTGAAHLQLMLVLPTTWPGWATAARPVEPSFAARFATAMGTPLPAKVPLPRRASRGAAATSEDDDGPASSGDPESADAATTPLTFQGGLPSPYRTRRSMAATTGREQHHMQAPPSPLCVSAGHCGSPSSLLMEGMVSRLTPTLEAAVNSPPPLHSERSLSQWLEEEIKRGPPPHMQAHAQRLAMARQQQAAAVQQLQLQQQQKQAAAAAAAAAMAAQAQQYGGHPAMRSLKRIRVGDDADATLDFPEPHFPALLGHGPAVAAPGASPDPAEDPIAAFVELMMMQTQQHNSIHPPVVELPAGVAAAAEDGAAKAAAAAAVMRATSPFMLPDATASICTPTPSALDDLLAGINGPFDGLEGVHDDATFPPAMRVAMAPGSYAVGVDASAR